MEDYTLTNNHKTLVINEGVKKVCIDIPREIKANIEKVILPASVTEIGRYAFHQMSSLKEIAIPDTVTRIEECAFKGCMVLEEISLPDSIDTILPYTFDSCSSLKIVNSRSGLKHIKDNAFAYCFNLTKIDLGKNIIDIAADAFRKCSSLILTFDCPHKPTANLRCRHFEFKDDNLVYNCGFHEDTVQLDKLFRFINSPNVKTLKSQLYGMQEYKLAIAFYDYDKEFANYIKGYRNCLIREAIAEEDANEVEFFVNKNLITKDEIDGFVEWAARLSGGLEAKEIYLLLVKYKEKIKGYEKEKYDFTL